MPELGPLLPIVLAVAIVGVGFMLTIAIRARIARRNRERPSGPRSDGQAGGAEMEDLARRLAAQLDDKAARLEVLLRQADERIEALGTAVPGGAGQSRGTRNSGPRPRAADPRSSDPLARAVYEHADAGLTSIEIAQELDEQVGKVELILALRERGP